MTAPNSQTPMPKPHPHFSGRSVLIVDDEPVIRTIARTALAAGGFEATEAGDPEAAMQTIRKASRPFDLILLDLTLGAASGADLIPRLRQESPTTRILVVSGLDSEEVQSLGPDGFLAKPFTRASLMITVWQTLSGGTPASKD
jgi:DNA-binding response OmpR family regulator